MRHGSRPPSAKNRDRLLEGDVARTFLAAVPALPRVRRLLSSDHFSVDGTLIEAWASMRSFKRKDDENGGIDPPSDALPPGDPPGAEPPAGGNAEVDFRGARRGNATHASTTDLDARLYRKERGREAKLCFIGHASMGEPQRDHR